MLPKLLVVSRNTWDDTHGTSSTLTNVFEDYDPDQLAHIYIETIQPNTKCCYRFFQISEFALVHKIIKWRIKTGHTINTKKNVGLSTDGHIAQQEANTMKYVRRHRSLWYSFAREILWSLNGWKSKELRGFIREFNPDVIWIEGSPLPLMNRLYNYILKIAKKPAAIFIQDDIYTYDSCPSKISSRLYKFYLRREVKRVVEHCDKMFVISQKMKDEYDKIFGFDSIIITKSFNTTTLHVSNNEKVHRPIRMVYMGQVIYGRINTLIDVAEALREINKHEEKIHLYVFTNNSISLDQHEALIRDGFVSLMPPVPYTDVPKVIAENDIVLFVESLDTKFTKVARLSFSTKICDYLASNKCIFAIGPNNIAPMEYFENEDSAIIAHSQEEIKEKLMLLTNKRIIEEYGAKSHECLKRNHDRSLMDRKIYGTLIDLSKK